MAEFATRYGPWAVVAGASQGIGEAWAHALAARGLNLVLTARRESLLRETAEAVAREHGVETRALALDLGGADALARLRALTDGLEVGFLVYNAAHAPIGEFLSQTLESQLSTIDVNCRGVLSLCHHYAGHMAERRRGGIVLMSSMSGWQGSAMVSVYAATKAFNTILAEGLWSELEAYGVDVQACVAGATLTPNFVDQTPVERQRGAFPMQPQAVVSAALARLGSGPTSIAGRVNRVAYFLLSKLLPRKVSVRFFSRTTRAMYADRTS